jgi:protein arginine kinase activator
MRCCICHKKSATVHLTEIVGDEVQKLDFCEKCATAKGVSQSTSFALFDPSQ